MIFIRFPTKSDLSYFGVKSHARIKTQAHSLQCFCYIVTHADSHLHTGTYICRIIHKDTTTKTDAWINDAGRKTQEDYFNNILPLTLFVRFACERVLETEHKLHILTPLLWPSRCVFLVLLMLGSTPSGLSEGPLDRVWLSLPHLVSSSLGSAGNCSGTQTQLS